MYVLLNQNPDFWNPRFFNTPDDSNQTKIPFTSQTLYSNFAPDFSNLIIFWTSYTITFPKVVTKIGIPLYLYIWACRERNPSNRKVSKQERQWQGMSLDLQIWSCSSCQLLGHHAPDENSTCLTTYQTTVNKVALLRGPNYITGKY